MITVESINSRLSNDVPIDRFWNNMKEVELELKQLILTASTEKETDDSLPLYQTFCKALVERKDSENPNSNAYAKIVDAIDYYDKDMPKAFNRHYEVINKNDLYDKESNRAKRIDYLFENLHLLEKREVKMKEVRELISYFISKSYTGGDSKEFYEEYLYKLNEIKTYIKNW